MKTLTEEIRSIITDQIDRHVAAPKTHREWLARDICERVTKEIYPLIEAATAVVMRDADCDREGWVKDGAGWDADMISLKHALRAMDESEDET